MSKPTTRRFFLGATLATGALATTRSARIASAANQSTNVNLGFISCGSRSNQLMKFFDGIDGTTIAGLCDPDDKRRADANKRFPKAKSWADMRELIADPNIDAVVIATCNHWHCLAAIWAMEAGKHVYVEKPLSHSQWEGLQTVAAAEKYKRVCQVGTMQRSDPMQEEIIKFLHDDKVLGDIQSVRVNRYGVRPPIGKRDTPLPIDKNVAYDLWLGPAQDEPLYRDKLHYDWHWDFNTGSGEMGNWGVHVLDDVRYNVFRDKVGLPKRIIAGGGRVAFNDAGNTPNVHFAYFDTGIYPVVIGLSNVPGKVGGNKSPEHPGPGSGYIVYCDGGRLEGQRQKAKAFDKDGKEIKSFKGPGGNVFHQANFINAVRANDPTKLRSPVKAGHDTTGWCNVANVAFRAGGAFSAETAASVDNEHWKGVVADMGEHLEVHGLSLDHESIQLSPMLEMDPETELFIGENADLGNKFIKREYRKGYEVPELVPVAV